MEFEFDRENIMGRAAISSESYVIGPDGAPLTFQDLPPPGLKRWVSRRKAEVVLAVEGGLLTLEEACGRYALTAEEFLTWEHGLVQHGLNGLKIGRIGKYRIAVTRRTQNAAQPELSNNNTLS